MYYKYHPPEGEVSNICNLYYKYQPSGEVHNIYYKYNPPDR